MSFQPGSTFRRWVRALAATLAVCAVIGGIAAAGTESASASPAMFTRTLTTAGLPFYLNLDVSQGSTSNGAPVITWWVNGGANQKWTFETVRSTPTQIIYRIRNVNSTKCLTTNGIAGGQLYQYSCFPDDPYQEWTTGIGAAFDGSAYSIRNVSFGLCVDVYGYNTLPGAKVDAWPCNSQQNQFFS